ncbi:hypothetical protein VTK26DRAFT_6817 [Humicola hyalothermophila]
MLVPTLSLIHDNNVFLALVSLVTFWIVFEFTSRRYRATAAGRSATASTMNPMSLISPAPQQSSSFSSSKSTQTRSTPFQQPDSTISATNTPIATAITPSPPPPPTTTTTTTTAVAEPRHLMPLPWRASFSQHFLPISSPIATATAAAAAAARRASSGCSVAARKGSGPTATPTAEDEGYGVGGLERASSSSRNGPFVGIMVGGGGGGEGGENVLVGIGGHFGGGGGVGGGGGREDEGEDEE